MRKNISAVQTGQSFRKRHYNNLAFSVHRHYQVRVQGYKYLPAVNADNSQQLARITYHRYYGTIEATVTVSEGIAFQSVKLIFFLRFIPGRYFTPLERGYRLSRKVIVK